MKIVRNTLLAMVIVSIPAASYAFVEIGAYGGYNKGTYDDLENNTSLDSKGPQYGAYAHFTGGLGNVYLGFGLFYHASSVTLSKGSYEQDTDINSLGVEAVVSLGFPMVPVSPYIRLGVSGRDQFKTGSDTENRYLASYHAGLGFAYKIVPLVSIFAEYFHHQLNTIHGDSQFNLVNNGGNAGLRLNL